MDRYKNIYDIDFGVIELVLKDFTYVSKKLYITNEYFKNKKGFIVFYAPWCKYSKKISELIIDIALSYLNIICVGAVNIENLKDNNDMLSVYANIEKYPTIKIIGLNGILEDYNKEYNIDNLIYFINS